MTINYQVLLDESILALIKKVLILIEKNRVDINQGFYISFYTRFPGVVLPQFVKQKYPKEMTIILQHQFKDLVVLKDSFTVSLTFSGVQKIIEIPFYAITSFVDLTASFNLQLSKGFPYLQNKDNDIEINKNISIKNKEPGCSKSFNLEKIKKQFSSSKIIYIDKFLNDRK